MGHWVRPKRKESLLLNQEGEIYKNKTSPNPSPPLPSLVLPVYDPPPPPLAMGLLDALYRVVMRRNAVYVTFVVAGAFAGERVRPPSLPSSPSPPTPRSQICHSVSPKGLSL